MGNDKIYDELLKQSQSIDRILRILESDSKLKTEGLVEQANRMDKEIQTIKSERAIEKAKFALLGSIAGLLGSLLFPLIQKIFQ